MSTDLFVPRRGAARDQAEQEMRDAFGERLKKLADAAGLTHGELAKKADLDRSVVTRLINGEHRVNGDQLARLSKALGVTAADLMPDGEARTLAPQARPQAGPPSVGEAPASRSGMVREHPARGYAVKTDEGGYIAGQLDAIPDKALRDAAMRACSAAIDELLHPHRAGAGERASRVRSR